MVSIDPSQRQQANVAAPAVPTPLQLRAGGWSARARAWRNDPLLAHCISYEQGTPVSAAVLQTWLRQLGEHGFNRVRTGALHTIAKPAYEAVGFHTVQTLTLLRADLRRSEVRDLRATTPPGYAFRRSTTRDIDRLADVDAAAFGTEWALDGDAIREAGTATATFRLRVAVDTASGRPVGYALSGRSAKASFLQRLAVHPDHQRHGVAAALVVDSLRWSIRWRAATVTVNTQFDNTPALTLYRRCGFVALPEQLCVMERRLDDLS